MHQKLQILSSEVKEGTGKKSGQAYRMVICQCVVTDTESGELKVGELTLPKDMLVPVPGFYVAEFKIGIDYQTKKIGGVLIGLQPPDKAITASPSSPVPLVPESASKTPKTPPFRDS